MRRALLTPAAAVSAPSPFVGATIAGNGATTITLPGGVSWVVFTPFSSSKPGGGDWSSTGGIDGTSFTAWRSTVPSPATSGWSIGSGAIIVGYNAQVTALSLVTAGSSTGTSFTVGDIGGPGLSAHILVKSSALFPGAVTPPATHANLTLTTAPANRGIAYADKVLPASGTGGGGTWTTADSMTARLINFRLQF